MNVFDQLETAVRRARCAWEAAHASGALEAGHTPDRYIAYAVLLELRAMLGAALDEEPAE